MLVAVSTTEEIRSKNHRIEELLLSISEGQMQAFEELYGIIKTEVFSYALSKTGNKSDASDIMQDTFLQIYRKAGLYNPRGKPMAWIMTIELNLIRRFYQLKSRTGVYDETFENVASEEELENKVINDTFLAEMMERLTDEEREVVALHVVSGLKHREIAKMLKRPLSTILSKYNRAIKKLQKTQKEIK